MMVPRRLNRLNMTLTLLTHTLSAHVRENCGVAYLFRGGGGIYTAIALAPAYEKCAWGRA
jgi:hypothetical protein